MRDIFVARVSKKYINFTRFEKKNKTRKPTKMDSTRPIKRARVDNGWPFLFDITDLAKLVFE